MVCLLDVSDFRPVVSGTSTYPCFAHMHGETALEHMQLPPECQPERLPKCGDTHVYVSAIAALAASLGVWALPFLLMQSMEDTRTCIQEDCSACGCCNGVRLTETAHTLALLHALHHVFDTLGHIADPWPVRCTAALRLLWRAWDEWSRLRPAFGGLLRWHGTAASWRCTAGCRGVLLWLPGVHRSCLLQHAVVFTWLPKVQGQALPREATALKTNPQTIR